MATGYAFEAEAQSYRFTSVAVEGNRHIDAGTITGFARIAQGRALTAGELNAAYQRVVATGFFRSVDFQPSGNRLVIRVEEYPLLNRVEIEGNRRLRDDALTPVLQSRAGGVFSPSRAEADANALAEAYAASGRLSARVTPRIIERPNGRVDLVFEVQEGRVVEVQRISFVGNRSFSERRLRNAIEASQAGRLSAMFRVDNYNEPRVLRDRQRLQDFYLSRGYVDAQVTAATTELNRERDGSFITFTVREGRQYRFGAVRVISELDGVDAAAYQAALSDRSGDLFTPNALEGLVEQAERVGYRSGERFVRAEPRLTRNERDGTVEVVLALVRGPREFVERIDVQGNVNTRDEVIRRQFETAEGDPVNPRELRAAAGRIRALGYFSDVQVNPVRGSAPDQTVVDVQVEETPTGSLGFGLSYGAVDGMGANITYSEANFLGRGQAFGMTLSTVSSARNFDLNFTEPMVLGRNLAFGLRFGLSSTTSNSTARFGSETIQISPSLTFPMSEYGRLSLRTTIMRDEITVSNPPALIEDPVGSGSFTNPDTIAARLRDDAALGAVQTNSIGFTYSFDTRRNGPDPDRGFLFRFGTDIAGLGGDRRWIRSTLLAGYEQRFFSGDVVLKVEFEAGVVAHESGDSRVNERFVLSSNQLRGFRAYGIGPMQVAPDGRSVNGLGGNTFAVARFDAEFPLGLPAEYNMAGGLFLDVGTLRGIDGLTHDSNCATALTAGCVMDNGAIRASAGVSLFWGSPMGPLRINFAVPLRNEEHDRTQRFDLSISSRF